MIAREELLGRLESFRPEDAGERASLERIRELVRTAVDPFTRAARDHVTASAVVASPDGRRFLLVHHRRLDRWLQPGGHVEPEDASVYAAALREAREETGVREFESPAGAAVLDVDVHPIPARADRPEHVHFDLRHLLTTAQEDLSAAPEEVRAARWFSLEEALAAGVDASLGRALRKARRTLEIASGRRIRE
ncbi:MAG: NUDIX hydrolase [Acidobacteriota bacterium]